MQVRFEQVNSPSEEGAVIKAQSQTDDIKAAIELLEGRERKIPLIKDGNNVLIETPLPPLFIACCRIPRADSALASFVRFGRFFAILR